MYALSRECVCHPDNDTGNLVTEPLSSNGRPLRFIYSSFQQHLTLLTIIINNNRNNNDDDNDDNDDDDNDDDDDDDDDDSNNSYNNKNSTYI
jgi:hypothetical protein